MNQATPSSTAEAMAQAQIITVTINNKPVQFSQHQATGLEIKQTAIAQGVSIQADFNLFRVKPNGSLELVRDDEQVALNKNREFRAVAPDDNS